ncbi:hypothetical protein RI129_003260 [Pyrocoelia pectoralis]|uniref:HAT C-terminal dimerisation domain-containing protein n=1 Tax=Pyrocoelia pectoralis TaxID=417401 RepID=A0AAN7ZUT6_9COLE
MAGIYKGVQARIQQDHKLAYFVPCAAHSLNLVGTHAAEASPEAQTFFGTINCLYVFFSSRWEVLEKHVTFSLKQLSKTRWSARKDLLSSETKTEATSLLGNISKFEFLVVTCFWYNILQKIDRVNKFLQRNDLTVDRAIRNIHCLLCFLESTRNNAPSDAIVEAKNIAENNNLPADFQSKRKRKKKRMFDEGCEDESPNLSEGDLFKIALLAIVDGIVNVLKSRFQALEEINEKFGFLNGSNFHQMDVKDLKAEVEKLSDIYQDDIINKEELLQEVESFKYHALAVDDTIKTAPAATLIYLHKLEEGYPNLTTALKIFLTLPVTVASGERSFSKLKLIKNYLRNTMGQDKLTNLSIISIEHKRASLICYDDIIKVFAAKKARKFNVILIFEFCYYEITNPLCD